MHVLLKSNNFPSTRIFRFGRQQTLKFVILISSLLGSSGSIYHFMCMVGHFYLFKRRVKASSEQREEWKILQPFTE